MITLTFLFVALASNSEKCRGGIQGLDSFLKSATSSFENFAFKRNLERPALGMAYT